MIADTLIRAAASRHRIRAADIVGHSQERYLVAPRREVAMALRASGWSLPRIGRVLGGRHHTSILYYLKTAKPPAPPPPPYDFSEPDYSGEWAI